MKAAYRMFREGTDTEECLVAVAQLLGSVGPERLILLEAFAVGYIVWYWEEE